jgi:uncharacterized repeat protein (TIGR02543 family)
MKIKNLYTLLFVVFLFALGGCDFFSRTSETTVTTAQTTETTNITAKEITTTISTIELTTISSIQKIGDILDLTPDNQQIKIQGVIYFISTYGYFVSDDTGMIYIYSPIPDGYTLGDEVIIEGNFLLFSERGLLEIANPVILERVSRNNDYSQTAMEYVPDSTELVLGQKYTVSGTVVLNGENEYINVYDGDEFLFIIHHGSTYNDSDNAIKELVGECITFDVIYYFTYPQEDGPGLISFLYQEGAEGIETVASSDYTLELNWDGTYEIIEYSGNESEVSIPSSHYGIPITRIRSAAFIGNYNLTSVVIPSGITYIGDYAFRYCINLTNIVFSDTLEIVGVLAFADCYSLRSVILPESILSIGELAFLYCTSLTQVFIPDNILIIGDIVVADLAFAYCNELTIYAEYTSEPEYWSTYWNVSDCPVIWGVDISNQSTITFNTNGGTEVSSITEDILSVVDAPTNPTRQGFTFSGWYSDEELTAEYTLETMPSLNIILYAGWTEEISDYIFSLLEDNTYEVVGYTGTDTHIVIPSSYSGLEVTSIGYAAFVDNGILMSVTIPASINDIQLAAFANCVIFSDITVDIENEYYSSENGVLFNKSKTHLFKYPEAKIGETYIVPSSVTEIDVEAFFCARYLETITIPSSVTALRDSAFQSAYALETVIFEEGSTLSILENQAFDGCVSLANIILPPSVTQIGSYAFHFTHDLITIIIPSGVSDINENAFGECDTLTIYAEIDSQPSTWNANWNPDPRPVIWGYVQGELTTLTFDANGGSIVSQINQPSGSLITEPEEPIYDGYLFSGWYSDEELTVEYTFNTMPMEDITLYACWIEIVVIPGYTFTLLEDDTYEITSYDGVDAEITIPSEYMEKAVTSIGQGAFEDCFELTSVTIPSGIRNIGNDAFRSCSNLVSVTIPNTVTNIGNAAFYLCSDLEEIEIPDSVLNIGSGAFTHCDKVVTIEIPDSVTNIGDEAFIYCYGLVTVVIPNSIIDMGYGVFTDCNNLTIYIVSASQPISWDSDWNVDTIEVLWGFDGVSRTYNFVVDGGTAVTDITTIYAIDEPSTTKDGYPFIEWYNNSELSGESISFPYYTSNPSETTLYAVWSDSVAEDGTTFASAYTISPEDELIVDVISAGQWVYYKFTPTVAMNYEIFASGSFDTFGNLYDSSFSQLIEDDDGGDGANFKLEYSFEAGVTYYIVARMYSTSTTGQFTLSLEGIDPFEYELIGGTYTITGYNGTNTDIVIPSSYLGVSVTGIDMWAFSFNEDITSIVIPISVTDIAIYSFSGCTSLTTIYAEAASEPIGWVSNWNSDSCTVVWGYTD